MFHLKTLLLITIASEACLAQMTCSAKEDWKEYYRRGECGVVTDKCSAKEDWQSHFLKGECDKFNSAVAKLNQEGSWFAKRRQFVVLIEKNYKGDLKMVEKMHNCISKLTVGTTFEVYQDKIRAYLSLNRALKSKSQRATDHGTKIAFSMGWIASQLNTTFKSPELEVLEALVDIYKNETLPSMRSICFDQWIKIKHANDKTELATDEYGLTQLWPIGTQIKVRDLEYRWFVEREFKTNIYGKPVIEVVLTDAKHSMLLMWNDKHGVCGLELKWKKPGYYHVWIAEFVRVKDDVNVSFKNKQTCNYLRADEYVYRTEKSLRVQKMTTNRTTPTYFTTN